VLLLLLSVQVVYPALDSKVKNVTSAYSVEHQDEVSQHHGPLNSSTSILTVIAGDVYQIFSNLMQGVHLHLQPGGHAALELVAHNVIHLHGDKLTRACWGLCYAAQEYLFEHLGSLLSAAVAQTGAERTATIR
jgi:hypothetical protein